VTENDLPRSGSILGVDFGTVRIGLAVGELGSGLVLPLPVLSNPGTLEQTAERIAEVARGREVAAVVLGNPIHVSGEASAMSAKVGGLKTALATRLSVPVVLRDERYSSVQAEEQLTAAGLKWWQYEKGKVDQLAAMSLVRELLIEIKPELGRVSEDDPTPPRREKDDPSRRKKRRSR